MSSNDTEIKAVLGNTLSNTRLLVMFMVFGLAMLVAVSIQDTNMRVCFWLSLVLLIVGILNLNLAITFYIKLRNERGIQGKRGERGDKGPKGFPGRCELNLKAKCGVRNCRAKIQEKLTEKCPHYKEVISKREVDRSTEENKMLNKYTEWINIINEQCGGLQSDVDEDKYFTKIFKNSEKYCFV